MSTHFCNFEIIISFLIRFPCILLCYADSDRQMAVEEVVDLEKERDQLQAELNTAQAWLNTARLEIQCGRERREVLLLHWPHLVHLEFE